MKSNFITILVVVLAVVVAVLAYTSPKNVVEMPLGGEGYAFNSTSTAGAITEVRVLKSTPGVARSVIITLAGTGTVRLYDATTSGAYAYGASSTIANFGASVAAGTYTIGAGLSRGLVADYAAFAGNATITWE